jgi:5-azacytidine-induced protein 1
VEDYSTLASNNRTTKAAEGLLEFGQRMCNDDLSASLNSRSSHHGGNEYTMDSQQDSLKATKLNSIANNMTSQAFSPGAKTPLKSLENSYQNIKHKTPVNQVRQVGRNVAEDYVKTCNMAATKIQRWFKRHQRRHKSGEAAVRRLLESKRLEKEAEMEQEKRDTRSKEEDRKKLREEKARQARQNAIQVLLYFPV